MSLPVWEEWIEIYRGGERVLTPLSLPVWEEWIEMLISCYPTGRDGSLPVWEEWIEITPRVNRSTAPRVSSRMGRVD